MQIEITDTVHDLEDLIAACQDMLSAARAEAKSPVEVHASRPFRLKLVSSKLSDGSMVVDFNIHYIGEA